MSHAHYLPEALLFAISCRIVSPRLLIWLVDCGVTVGEDGESGELMANVSTQSGAKQERKIIDDER